MIIAFVVDTDHTMASRPIGGGGWSLLDSAKGMVEHVIKSRRSSGMGGNAAGAPDHYMLVTTEPGLDCVKSGWSDPLPKFDAQLKTLSANVRESVSIGCAVGSALRLMNQHRLMTAIDQWGRGLSPWVVEPGAVIVFTGGDRGVMADGILPADALTPQLRELSRDPFRWDQRVFAVLIEPGCQPSPSLRFLCEVTGGLALGCAKNSSPLQPSDMVLFRLQQRGPVVSFMPAGGAGVGSGEAPPSPVRALLSLRMNTGSWPIPEAFWVDKQLDVLPQRTSAQPVILYAQDEETVEGVMAAADLIDRLGLSLDWYELEWCKPGETLRMGRQTRWPVCIRGSGRGNGEGEFFGFLRSSPVVGRIILVILPYNFPRLAQLLRQAMEASGSGGGIATLAATLPPQWRQELLRYLAGTPSYYLPSLHRALKGLSLHNLLPPLEKGGDVSLSRKVIARLNRLRELCAMENDRVDLLREPTSARSSSRKDGREGSHADTADVDALAQIPVGELLSVWNSLRQDIFGAGGITTSGLFSRQPAGVGPNKGRKGVGELERFLYPCAAGLAPAKSVSEMSNYMKVLLSKDVLRDPHREPEPDEDTPQGAMRRKLTVNFGNPFRGSRSRLAPSHKISARLDVGADIIAPVDAAEGECSMVVDEAADEAELLTAAPSTPIHSPWDDTAAQVSVSPPLPVDAAVKPLSLEEMRAMLPKLVKDRNKRKRPLPGPPSHFSSLAPKLPSPPTSPSGLPLSPFQTAPIAGSAQGPDSVALDRQNADALPMEVDVDPPGGDERHSTAVSRPQGSSGSISTTSSSSSSSSAAATSSTTSVAAAEAAPSSSSLPVKPGAAEAAQPAPQPVLQQQKGEESSSPQSSPVKQAAAQEGGGDGAPSSTTTSSSSPDAGQQQAAPTPQQPVAQHQPDDYALPEGWVVCKSRREQRYYFFNLATQESLWQPPPGSVLKAS